MDVRQLTLSFNCMTFRVSSKPFELSDARRAQVDESGILAWAQGINFQGMTDARRNSIPQFRASAKLKEFLESRFSKSF